MSARSVPLTALPANPTLPIGRGIRRGDRFRADQVASAWQERRDAILLAYSICASLTLTGRLFAISKQRVSQIVHHTYAA
jgi:hypothetical protein